METTIPRPGMLATIRNRRALVTAVEEFSGRDGEVSRLVTVKYMDAHSPPEDNALWGHEQGADIIEAKHLPQVELEAPMPVRDFEAVQRAARWLALSPYVGIDGLPDGASPIASPLFGAILVEDPGAGTEDATGHSGSARRCGPRQVGRSRTGPQ